MGDSVLVKAPEAEGGTKFKEIVYKVIGSDKCNFKLKSSGGQILTRNVKYLKKVSPGNDLNREADACLELGTDEPAEKRTRKAPHHLSD
ncbi:MAG: hypothetical protein ACRDAX_05415 [Propionibacteriaceae bacterium]